MASGFITLEDGRDFAVRWNGYDILLNLIINSLGTPPDEQALQAFLRTMVPPPDMPEGHEMGWGFIRPSDEEKVSRILDLRGLTPQYRRLFWQALQRAFQRIMLGAPHPGTDFTVRWLRELLRARRLVARGQVWSDWEPQPFDGEQIGPGWEP